jgi:dihydroxyacetone kinase-like protein
LEQVIAAAQRAIDNTRSIGIGLSACTIPAAGKPNFTIAEGMMEVGIGHHGEPGIAVMPIGTAREMAALMVERILGDAPADAGASVAVLVSGLGATPLMELYLLYGHVEALLRAAGLTVERRLVGNYFTSLEMLGVSVTVMWLDPELNRLMGRPAASIGLAVAGD